MSSAHTSHIFMFGFMIVTNFYLESLRNMLKIQKFDLLIALYILCLTISELMGGKTFSILRVGPITLNASIAIFVVPILFTIDDVITEVYGRARAQSVIRAGLLMVFFLLLFSLLATSLPPTKQFAPSEKSYEAVFAVSARIIVASLISFTISQFTDVLIFAKIRQRIGPKRLWLRTNISNFISQFLDTTIFLSLAFYALDKTLGANLGFLLSLILPYWILKCFMSVIETPFVYFGVRWLKNGKGTSANVYEDAGDM